jgi:hypothetical protein
LNLNQEEILLQMVKKRKKIVVLIMPWAPIPRLISLTRQALIPEWIRPDPIGRGHLPPHLTRSPLIAGDALSMRGRVAPRHVAHPVASCRVQAYLASVSVCLTTRPRA